MHRNKGAKAPKRSVASMIILGCLVSAGFSVAPAFADATSEMRAEVAAQRVRLDALEKKLEAATKEVATAKEAANQATIAAASNTATGNGGGLLPKGLSIYGVADAGFEYGNYGQGYKGRVQSGLGTASRLGFKGERDFSKDLTAYFLLEAGISFDNGQNTGHSSNISNPGPGVNSSAAPNTTGVAIFSRNTFVGLRSKKFGDVRFGRDYTPQYAALSQSDPFSLGGATALRLWSGSAAGRFDNGAFYYSPQIAGFSVGVAYSTGMENNTSTNTGTTGLTNFSSGPRDEGKGTSGALTYKKGPVFATVGYLDFLRQGSVTGVATDNVRRQAWNLGASYDLKVVKLFGQYMQVNDQQQGAATGKTMDREVMWAGISVPFAEVHTVKGVVGYLNDKLATNRDSTHLGAGYEYALDKQTDLYAYYAQVSNKNGGTTSLCAGGTCQGYDIAANVSPKSFMLGTRYRF